MTGPQITESRVAACRVCRGFYDASVAQTRKLDFICKPCRAERDRDYRERRKERGLRVSGKAMPREYHHAYQQAYRERPEVRERKRLEARRRQADPVEREKANVRRLTRREIEAGRLVRQPCEVCGLAKVDAHHDDYAQPLKVRWLCRVHHAEHHAKARGEVA